MSNFDSDYEQIIRRSNLLHEACRVICRHLPDGCGDWLSAYALGETQADLLESAHPILMSLENPDRDERQLIADIEGEF